MSKIAEAFDGDTFETKRDGARLNVQLDHVRSVMFSAQWLTLDEIKAECLKRYGTDYPTASISARLRDLRKIRFGGYGVDRRRRAGEKGLFEYRLNFGGSRK